MCVPMVRGMPGLRVRVENGQGEWCDFVCRGGESRSFVPSHVFVDGAA